MYYVYKCTAGPLLLLYVLAEHRASDSSSRGMVMVCTCISIMHFHTAGRFDIVCNILFSCVLPAVDDAVVTVYNMTLPTRTWYSVIIS